MNKKFKPDGADYYRRWRLMEALSTDFQLDHGMQFIVKNGHALMHDLVQNTIPEVTGNQTEPDFETTL
ncbi:MAG: hypothetical protein H6936_06230 [Burkholderiales bacterium]|nr:hypothetical protein [Nitrosomonas sp.]MCP5274441.1 hypothetical protein [Burkholderiales bacterium]